MIRLAPVKITDASHQQYLWQLLGERKLSESISHRKMPSYQEHLDFVRRSPVEYEWWFLIEVADGEEWQVVGACYLTYRREIGIQIAQKHRRKGYAKAAVQKLMAAGSALKGSADMPFLANVAPDNGASIALFTELGFKTISMTLRRDA